MNFLNVQETVSELAALERSHPLMINRLRWLRTLRTHPLVGMGAMADRLGVNEYEIEKWAALYYVGGMSLLLKPQTALDRANSQIKTFSEHAEGRMWDLLKEHQNQLGRQLWIDFEECRKTGKNKREKYDCGLFRPYEDFAAKYRDWYRTDCQTYILDVIKYAYEKTGQRNIYTGLLAAFRKEGTTGTVMAKYLVRQGWKAYLFMPDTNNPAEDELDDYTHHVKMYQGSAKSKTWWNVPLAGFIVNYNPTATLNFTATKLTDKDPAGERKFKALSNVRFSFCVFTKGLHTALHSKGMIYEVHWDVLSEQSRGTSTEYGNFYGQPLYESRSLWNFPWLEGIIVVPPDDKANLG